MQRWDMADLEGDGRRGPRVLVSEAGVRVVTLDLAPGEVLGDHRVRERAVLVVVSGLAEVASGALVEQAGGGTVIAFAPSETHAVRAVERTRLVLVLAPWPADGHFAEDEDVDPRRRPARAAG